MRSTANLLRFLSVAALARVVLKLKAVHRWHRQAGRTIRGPPRIVRESVLKVLHYAAIFFLVAVIAAVFGVGGVASGAGEVAKILFFIFLIVAAVMLVLGLIGGGEE